MTDRIGAGPKRSALYAFAGYLTMLGLGRLIGAGFAGDSFPETAVVTVTTVVLAPLAALAGATVGLLSYRRWRLSRVETAQFWSALALVLGIVGVTSLWLDLPTAVTTLLVGSTALVVMRVALIERQVRTGRL